MDGKKEIPLPKEFTEKIKRFAKPNEYPDDPKAEGLRPRLKYAGGDPNEIVIIAGIRFKKQPVFPGKDLGDDRGHEGYATEAEHYSHAGVGWDSFISVSKELCTQDSTREQNRDIRIIDPSDLSDLVLYKLVQEKNKEGKTESFFNAGINKITRRVDDLLEDKDYVVVSIAGPLTADTHVGKSKLTSELEKELREMGIPYCSQPDVTQLNEQSAENLRMLQKILADKKGVIILNADYSPERADDVQVVRIRESKDAQIKEVGEKLKLPLTGIDIRVLIYRPDRPADAAAKKYADIIICNEHAQDKY